MIVCIEGIDAAGKATQAAMLATHLNCGVLSFPDYQTLSGQLIHRHLKNEWRACYDDDADVRAQQLDAAVFQSLMLTNQMEKASFIHSCRINSDHLVLDRYWPSSFAYGSGDSLDARWLIQIHQNLPQPHYYLLLDLPPERSGERRPDRRDRYELQPGLMEEVAHHYRALWGMMHESHASKWRMIDGGGSIERVHERIVETIGNDHA